MIKYRKRWAKSDIAVAPDGYLVHRHDTNPTGMIGGTLCDPRDGEWICWQWVRHPDHKRRAHENFMRGLRP